jgi:Carbohydrate binding module (family 6)
LAIQYFQKKLEFTMLPILRGRTESFLLTFLCTATLCTTTLLPSTSFARDPLTPANTRLAVPGHIEAEDFAAVTGINVRETGQYEAGGGEVLSRITNGENANYGVRVAAAGTYSIRIRYSSDAANGGTLVIKRGGSSTELGRINLASTGDWEVYQTALLKNIALTAGDQTIEVRITGGSGDLVNLNWLYLEAQASTAAPAYQIYVSPTAGSDNNSGDINSPYLTLKKAADRLQQINQSDATHGPITVWLREGYHEQTSALTLTSAHTGTANGPVTFRGYGNERVIVGTGKRIDVAKFSLAAGNDLNLLHPSARGKVYVANLAGTDFPSRFDRANSPADWGMAEYGQMSYNGSLLQLARYPNKGWTSIKDVTGKSFKPYFAIDGAAWKREFDRTKRMRISGHLSTQDFEKIDAVGAIANDSTITFSTINDFSQIGGIGKKLRILNVLYDLDIPGEWYFDKGTQKLYLYPVAALSLNPDIRVGANHAAITGAGLSYLTFRDLIFQDTNADPLIRLDGDHITLGGSTIRNVSTRAAVRMIGSANRVTGNNFYDVHSPMALSSTNSAPRPFPHVPGHNEVSNNHVTGLLSFGYGGGGAGTIGAIFSNNLYNDMNSGPTWSGNGNLMELNEFYDSGWAQGDWNVAYMGVSYSHWGNLVRHNFVHNMIQQPGGQRTGALRNDDGGTGLNYFGNITYKTGEYAMTWQSIGSIATNNIWIETRDAFLTRKRPYADGGALTAGEVKQQWARNQAITASSPYNKQNFIFNAEQILGSDFWTKPYFAYKYPTAKRAFDVNPFAFQQTEFRRNYYNKANPIKTELSTVQELQGLGLDYQAAVEIDPASAFENLDTLNFKFKNSFTPQAGFSTIPFAKIGLYTDEFRKAAPHKDSYRAGARLKWASKPANPVGTTLKANPATDNDLFPEPNFNQRTEYDLGSYTSPLFLHYTLVTPDTKGEYGWVANNGLDTRDRELGNAINRDVIFSSQTNTFEQVVESGPWYVMVTFGDIFAHDSQAVDVEGVRKLSNINTAANEYRNEFVAAYVRDGKLSITFSDQGGADKNWTITRIITQNTPFTGQTPLANTTATK